MRYNFEMTRAVPLGLLMLLGGYAFFSPVTGNPGGDPPINLHACAHLDRTGFSNWIARKAGGDYVRGFLKARPRVARFKSLQSVQSMAAASNSALRLR